MHTSVHRVPRTCDRVLVGTVAAHRADDVPARLPAETTTDPGHGPQESPYDDMLASSLLLHSALTGRRPAAVPAPRHAR